MRFQNLSELGTQEPLQKVLTKRNLNLTTDLRHLYAGMQKSMARNQMRSIFNPHSSQCLVILFWLNITIDGPSCPETEPDGTELGLFLEENHASFGCTVCAVFISHSSVTIHYSCFQFPSALTNMFDKSCMYIQQVHQ